MLCRLETSIELRIVYIPWMERSNWKCHWIAPKQTTTIQCRFVRCKLKILSGQAILAPNQTHSYINAAEYRDLYAQRTVDGDSQQDFRFIEFENYKLPVFTTRKYWKFCTGKHSSSRKCIYSIDCVPVQQFQYGWNREDNELDGGKEAPGQVELERNETCGENHRRHRSVGMVIDLVECEYCLSNCRVGKLNQECSCVFHFHWVFPMECLKSPALWMPSVPIHWTYIIIIRKCYVANKVVFTQPP